MTLNGIALHGIARHCKALLRFLSNSLNKDSHMLHPPDSSCILPCHRGRRSHGWSPSWHHQLAPSESAGGSRSQQPCPGRVPWGRTGSMESPCRGPPSRPSSSQQQRCSWWLRSFVRQQLPWQRLREDVCIRMCKDV